MNDNVMAAVVLGAPRSGTSMLTNITTALGLYAGEKDELFWDSDFYSNEKGFFELLELRDLSKSIQSERHMLMMSLDDKLELIDESVHQSLMEQLIVKMADRVKNMGNGFVMKEVRMYLAMPAWDKAFKSQNIDRKILFIFRHPEEFAGSQARSGGHYDKDWSLKVWYYKNAMMIKYLMTLEPSEYVILDHKMFFESDDNIRKIAKVLNREDREQDALGIVDSGLRHNNYSREANPSIDKGILDMYDFLVHHAETNEPFKELPPDCYNNLKRYSDEFHRNVVSRIAKDSSFKNDVMCKEWSNHVFRTRFDIVKDYFKSFFNEKGISDIAIYGCGSTAYYTYNALKKAGINIAGVYANSYDRELDPLGAVKHMGNVTLLSEVNEKLDIPVINTIVQGADKVNSSLLEYFDGDGIFPLIDMIYDATI